MYNQIKSYRKCEHNVYNGMYFDSRKEAGEGRHLEQLKEKGEIKDWQKQYKLDFYVEIIKNKPILICNPDSHVNKMFLLRYYIDFFVTHNDGTIELIEVKGQQTNDYRLKRNLMEAVYGNDPNYQLTIIT